MLFHLLYGEEEICYAKGTEMKPSCSKLECNGKHIKWLREILASKGAPDVLPTRFNRFLNIALAEEEGMAPDGSWLQLEAT